MRETYRVVQFRDRGGVSYGVVQVSHGLEALPTVMPTWDGRRSLVPERSSLDDLRRDLWRMLRACEEPVLLPGDLDNPG